MVVARPPHARMGTPPGGSQCAGEWRVEIGVRKGVRQRPLGEKIERRKWIGEEARPGEICNDAKRQAGAIRCHEHAFARISVGRVRNRAPTSARHGGSSTGGPRGPTVYGGASWTASPAGEFSAAAGPAIAVLMPKRGSHRSGALPKWVKDSRLGGGPMGITGKEPSVIQASQPVDQ